ncbi:unnamed protein product, partial [Pylaiella littoralis]
MNPAAAAPFTSTVRRKRRGWMFYVDGVRNHGVTEADILASLCEGYTTVKKLVVRPGLIAPASQASVPASEPSGSALSSAAAPPPPAPPASASSPRPQTCPTSSSFVLVEVQFVGPQPSERCGALLCQLLGGDSVDARPMELPRGRKKSRTSTLEDNASLSTMRSASSATDVALSDAEHASASLPTKPGGTGAASSGVLLPHAIPGEDTPARMLPQEEPNHQVVLQPYQHRQQIEADNGLLFFAPPLPALAPLGPGSFASMHDGNNSDGGRVLLPMEEVRVEPSRKECDWEGRPSSTAGQFLAPPESANGRQCYLVFTGLGHTGHSMDSLRATALFGVDAVHQIGTVTSPIEIGADGRGYALVFYPSMQEIWPELYHTAAIRMVEVDVAVEILSDSGGEYQFT